ncbi:MAG: 1-acyl-sn-glycerol-3-phosphate acyltransferase [Anaerolineales bacterium]|jgi:1-acyl-sn-glycerol-3-phosphate acyltransferase
MDFPRYSYPPWTVLGLAANVLFGRRRSFRADGQACLARLEPPLRLLDAENIPTAGPCLITFNHYYRPGFDAWWMALAIAATAPVDVHFIMTSELTYPGKWYAPLGKSLSRALLRRLSKVYGFTSMPPMPPRPEDVQARARSVRAALAYANEHPQAILGLAPEGGDQPGGVLNWPPSGAGRFLALLGGAGFPILPVGTYEEAGEFCLHFGKPLQLHLPGGVTNEERDRAAARIVMAAIARLVPPRLRGEFNIQS